MRWPLGSVTRRLRIAVLAVAVIVAGFGFRLIQLQGIDSAAYAQAASAQMKVVRDLPAKRGSILDANGRVLVASEPAVDVIADPLLIAGDPNDPSEVEAGKADARGLADLLAKHFGGSPYSYIGPLLDTSLGHYAVIKKQVPTATFRAFADEMQAAGLYGIFKEDNPIRSYPNGALASNVLGFMNAEGVGAAGLEYSLNRQLSGTPGTEAFDASAYGRIPMAGSVLTPAKDGTTYTLTLNSEAQQMLEMSLAQATTASGGKTGFAITMDVTNGEIIAMANYPSFSPTGFATANPADLGNRAITQVYEPGSVQKVFTMSMLLDQGLITPDTQVSVPPAIKSGDSMVYDAWEHGTVNYTARGVLARSSNIGTIVLGRQLPKETYVSYMEKFGFSQPTGIELPGEQTGVVNPAMSSGDYDRALFGQSVSVTGIEMAAGLSAVANGGMYNPPTLIKGATDANGKPIPVTKGAPRRVISEKAADQTLDMMEAMVVSNGKLLVMDNYRQGAKTGTAQRYNEKCGCYPQGSWTMSYVSVAPVESPRYLTYMVVDEPTVTGANAGINFVGPGVRDYMKYLLPVMGVPMSTTPARKEPLTW